MTYSRVPHDARFWRRGDVARWNRLGDAASCDDDTRAPWGALPEAPAPDERVMLDPQWCPVCLGESRDWPPGPCVHCGAAVDGRRSLEDAKRAIRDWTGNPDPHV